MPSLDDLVGIPFVPKGRTKNGSDCWGIFKMVQERFGNNVPDVNVSSFATELINEEMKKQLPLWKKVDTLEPGDAITMRLDPKLPDTEQHFAVYIGNGKMIHTLVKTGAIVVRVDHPYWKNKITGFYRWNG